MKNNPTNYHTSSGKLCTLCGESAVYTTESRVTKDYVRRTKICSHCGNKYNTAECLIDDYKMMLKTFRFFDKHQIVREEAVLNKMGKGYEG